MWFTAAAQLIGQEAQGVSLNTANPYLTQEKAAQASDPWGTIALVVGGVAALAGLYWVLR